MITKIGFKQKYSFMIDRLFVAVSFISILFNAII